MATSDLARFIPRPALALARTIPQGLAILFDELPSSSANELSKAPGARDELYRS